jgi:hypothetical protein
MLGKCCFAKKRVERKINRRGEWWWEEGQKNQSKKAGRKWWDEKNLDATLPTAPLGVEI